MTRKSLTAVGIPAAGARALVTVAAAAALALPAAAEARESAPDVREAAQPAASEAWRSPASGRPIDQLLKRAAMSPLLEQHTRRGSSGGGGGQAVPRGGSGAPSGGGSRGGGGTSVGGTTSGRSGSDQGGSSGGTTRGGARTRGTTGEATASGGDTPTYSRPRGDRPATGTAVERRPGDRAPVIIDRGGYYGGWYPWGWGGLGLGGYYGYYDPWGWYDPYPPAIYATGGYDGALKIKVKPRDAEVYVDGYFAGEVDDYDGVFQKLRLDPGPHRIEIRLEGYEPLSFEVRIQPDRTVTYKGDLKKAATTN